MNIPLKIHQGYLQQKRIFYSGNIQLLKNKTIGIFSSRDIPLSVVVPAEKLMMLIAELPYTFISGWLSPFERRILKKLSITGKEIIFFNSRGIKDQPIYNYLRKPLREGKLLIISFFDENPKVTGIISKKRNEIISEIVDYNLFLYINKGGYLEKLISKLVSEGKPSLVFNCPLNSNYLQMNRPIDLHNIKEILLAHRN